MARTAKSTSKTTKTGEKATTKTTKRSTTSAQRTSTPATKSVTKARTRIMPTEEQIRLRAYEIYQRRNGGPGDPHADWAQAEHELINELSR